VHSGHNRAEALRLITKVLKLSAWAAALKRVMRLVEQVACHPAAVLIVGETGTGKEMIARSIHAHSLRCNKPLWM